MRTWRHLFKMQTLDRDIPNLVSPGDYMLTRDLEKACYKIPIERDSTKYQCFYWKGKFYKARSTVFVRLRLFLQRFVE